MLEFNVNGQKLTRIDHFEPATDSQGYLKAKFNFNDSDWNGKTKKAYFRIDENVYSVQLDSSGVCKVASEVLVHTNTKYYREHGSSFFVSLAGVYNGTRITTDEIKIKLNTSGYAEAENASTPTPTEIEQLQTAYADAQTASENAQAASEAAVQECKDTVDSLANAIKGNLTGVVVRADDVSPVEHSVKALVRGKNLFDVSKIVNTNVATNNGDGSITIAANNYYCRLNQKLCEVCPQLKAGETAVLSFNSSSKNTKYMYFHGLQGTWLAGHYITLTSEILDSYITIYGFADNDSSYGQECVISDIQIEIGKVVTEYTPYIDPATVTVRSCGKNLFPVTVGTYNGVTLSKYSDYYMLNGTATGSGLFITKIGILPPGTYTLSANNPTHNNLGNIFVPIVQVYSPDTLESVAVIDDRANGVVTATIKGGENFESRIRYQEGITYNNFIIKPQFELNNTATAYEAFKETSEHTPSSDGIVEGITSLSPTMTLLTDTEGITVECEYNRDTNKVIDNLIKAVVALGGTV